MMKRLVLSLACSFVAVASTFAGTPTQYYVDTVGGSNSDNGTSFANAFLTLKYAIETGITRDATNGDQINVYAPVGTPDDYSSGDPAITMSDYATDATATAPFIVRGVASDGTTPAIAYVTCAGRYLVNDAVFDFSRWINISVVGGSADGLWQMDRSTGVFGCLFNNTAGGDVVEIDGASSSVIAFSDVQGASGNGYLINMLGSSGNVIGNYVHERTNSCRGIASYGSAIGNVIHMNSTNAAGNALATGAGGFTIGNTCINDAAGVVGAIAITGANALVFNNYVEGWSGTGGAAISTNASNTLMVAANRYYNCTSGFSLNDTDYASDNSVTTASGVVDRAAGDYTPTAELQEIGIPLAFGGTTSYINVGAVQNQADVGGGGGTDQVTITPFYSGDIQEGTGNHVFDFVTSLNGVPSTLTGGAIQARIDGGAASATGLTLATISTGHYKVTVDSDNAVFDGGGNISFTLSAGTVGGISQVNAKVGEVSVGRNASVADVTDDLLSRVLASVTGPPGDTPTFEDAVAWLAWITQARIVTDDDTKTIYGADGTTAISEEAIDDSTPGTIDKAAAGAP
jgi:hypothetical protein